MGLTMKAWFRALAAAMKSEATAQAIAGISVLVLVLYTGYGEYQMAQSLYRTNGLYHKLFLSRQ